MAEVPGWTGFRGDGPSRTQWQLLTDLRDPHPHRAEMGTSRRDPVPCWCSISSRAKRSGRNPQVSRESLHQPPSSAMGPGSAGLSPSQVPWVH